MKWPVLAVFAILITGAAVYAYRSSATPSASAKAPTVQESPVDYSKVAFTKAYSNDEYRFSLSMPENFSGRELQVDDSGAKTILLESVDHSDGVQITVIPFDEDIRTLTEARIHQDVPDMKISEPQPVEIGQNYTGLAFKSDNEAFGGASREVWFVFRGHLYQISTYDRLDPLLQKIFSTWKFF